MAPSPKHLAQQDNKEFGWVTHRRRCFRSDRALSGQRWPGRGASGWLASRGSTCPPNRARPNKQRPNELTGALFVADAVGDSTNKRTALPSREMICSLYVPYLE